MMAAESDEEKQGSDGAVDAMEEKTTTIAEKKASSDIAAADSNHERKIGALEEEICTELAPELEGLIRTRLPISSCIKFASVCKDWYSIISSPAFTEEISLSQSGKYPFLFLWGMHSSFPYSLSCMYDPIAARWFRTNPNMPHPPITSQHHGLVSGVHGPLIFYSIGPSSPRTFNFHYALYPTSIEWQPISPACSARSHFPVVAAFYNDSSLSLSFKIFVLSSSTMVHLYDSDTNRWEHCDSLPNGGFLGAIGSFNISSVVIGCKIYIVGMSSGTITSFDVGVKKWSELRDLRIMSALYILITSSRKGLFAIGLCHAQDGKCLKLFKVNEHTMECEEVSRMPQELWSLFEDQPKLHLTRLKCVGSGNLVYVYYGSFFNDIRACACDLRDYTWWRLPDLPSPLRDCEDRVQCCSIELLPMACLKLEKIKTTRVEQGVAKRTQ